MGVAKTSSQGPLFSGESGMIMTAPSGGNTGLFVESGDPEGTGTDVSVVIDCLT